MKDDTGPLLLLETVPGMRYRSRRNHQDEKAARQYFRNMVEAHANGSLDQPILPDLAGVDAAQVLQFQHSLRFITEDELQDLDLTSPLGAGQNGKVFKATWKKPRSILVRPRDEKECVDVVLKEVIPRQGSAEEALKKLIKEVRDWRRFALSAVVGNQKLTLIRCTSLISAWARSQQDASPFLELPGCLAFNKNLGNSPPARQTNTTSSQNSRQKVASWTF